MSEIFRTRFSVIDRLILISLLYYAIQIAVILARVYRSANVWGPAMPKFGNINACYTCVSAILKVLSLLLTLLIMYVYDKLVDKCLLTTMLKQLKAAVLVKLFVEA